MDLALALLLKLMRRVRYIFVALYLVVSTGFLYVEPRSGWTWFIVVAGAALCLAFWGLVGFWTYAFARRQSRDGRNGTDHG
ncbi:hypothetical protein SAMN05216304_101434 [Bosea sp. OK403]|uniref:hypothetical protein n=1 Tax=Bosea sp. OK403 TaxID=1855286 RepID=UPI0008E60D46|nr:hypothetical protein [Bosea sp. OK403]SFI02060.1 hypothetical protein SAMN05216304_101434 [Bosea sp. OK403]